MKHTTAVVGGVGWIVVAVLLVVSLVGDRPSTRTTSDDSTRDVVTRLQLRPGETLRLAQPIGAFDVTCSAEGHP